MPRAPAQVEREQRVITIRLSSTRLDSHAPRAMGQKESRALQTRPHLFQRLRLVCTLAEALPQKERESSPPPEVSQRAREEVRQLTTRESCRPAHAHGR
uniref:Uncharacterized protein n=1 Tax=Rangifer tarandus platyrhynchus TaxID=3082113 RepID=A0ACB0EE60_RANTA|nr:unnamed protein product [Rangifer tarandus platyrhynchus]